ncbi:MAG: ribosome small subunit-dependent GTPase A [Neisseria sp.]|nr:ribosome small subunit-dependent GTPase A [Neisseria sp.]
MNETARIIASYGLRYTVRTGAGQTYDATARKKRVDFACGDFVHIRIQNSEQAVITDHLPRKSLLYRQDARRTKLIAANADCLFVITAAVPAPDENLLQRALVAAEAGGMEAFIVLNKTDLPESGAWGRKLDFYRALGYPVIETCALHGADGLRPFLAGRTSVFLGRSGTGKSTLTNALLGHDAARTGGLSCASGSGRHTTTHAKLYDLAADTFLIDSPGLQEFGLHHLPAADLALYFPDMRRLAGGCRFRNCSHREEPGCAFKQAAEEGAIRPERLQLLQRLAGEAGGK